MKPDRPQDELQRLAEMMADDLVQTPDEDIEREDGDSDEAVMASAAKDLAAVRNRLGKAKLLAAKQAAKLDQSTAALRHTVVDITTARDRLSSAVSNTTSANKFTLAARDGKGVADEDLAGLIEDAEDLGIDLDGQKAGDPDAG